MREAGNNTFSFGEFEVDAEHRLLLKTGAPVTLKPKTFDLLLTLVENHGRILTKNELLDKVWENQFVEENNLTVHVAALRKALGETKNENKFIVTVPGKGYQFVAEMAPPTNGDLVVERHRLEKIVVEEAIVESEATHQSTRLQSRFRPTRRIAIVAAAVILAMIGGGYALRQQFGPAAVAPFVGHTVRQLTTNGNVGLAALAPDGKSFAYTIDDLGQKSLWLGYVEGGNHLQLRPPAETSYRSLAFSPDSSQLYFSIRDDKNPQFTLYRMPALGGAAEKVLEGIRNFSLSPDGKQIAIARSDKEQEFLVVAPLDGLERRDVAAFPKSLAFRSGTISWSPDATRLAVSVARNTEPYSEEVAVIKVSTGEIEKIPIENLREITKTAWLQDGSGILLTAVEMELYASVPQYQIWHLDYPGGELRPVTTDRSNYGASWHNDAGVTLSPSSTAGLLLSVEHRQLSNIWVAPSDDLAAAKQITLGGFGKYDGIWGLDWTNDGKLIYNTSNTRNHQIAMMNADGTEQKVLTEPPGFDSQLTVTSDGRYILANSNRGGSIDVWRFDIDGGNPKQLTFGGKAVQGLPSPDGKWVYYSTWISESTDLRRVPIDGGEPEIVNDKPNMWGSFSPDGKYFAASHVTDKNRLAIFSTETNQVIKQFELPKTGTLYMGSRWTPDSKAVAYRDNAFGYWIQPVDAGEPQRLEGLPKEKLYNFAWSKDGKWFAYVRGPEIRDVVLFTYAK